MDCDSCGRYRPSPEIAPLRDSSGRLVMACARCRRLAGARRDQVTPAEGLAPKVATRATILVTPR
jgi:hypothetical protein